MTGRWTAGEYWNVDKSIHKFSSRIFSICLCCNNGDCHNNSVDKIQTKAFQKIKD